MAIVGPFFGLDEGRYGVPVAGSSSSDTAEYGG
jgi:hypothetical protein